MTNSHEDASGHNGRLPCRSLTILGIFVVAKLNKDRDKSLSKEVLFGVNKK
jgi:hypothetical protein